jgi:hypothetical protein
VSLLLTMAMLANLACAVSLGMILVHGARHPILTLVELIINATAFGFNLRSGLSRLFSELSPSPHCTPSAPPRSSPDRP